tara:strand:- start:810 stop:1715 length:906 start_codon:yes stop_codon:yes gene_type:complete
MTFFNKKEEVFDIQLTSEGKRQLANGKFKPKFYAFYDDEILYDISYASSTEEQNESQDRILDDTPYPKINARFKGAKPEGKDNYNKNNKKNEETLAYDIFMKESPFMTTLGSYNSLTQEAPYYNVSVLSKNVYGLTTGSSNSPRLFAQVTASDGSLIVTGGTTETYIPQINITSSYQYYYHQATDTVYSREDPIILEIIEKNTQFSNFKDNFEIEVFEIIEENSKLSSAKLFIVDDGAPRTPLEQISHQLKIQTIENELENLVGESLEVLLDEQAESLFPPELLTKKNPNAKSKTVCDDEK